MLKSDQIKKIHKYLADKPVEVVYLFGSQAGDNTRPDSDYDFGVLYEDGLPSSERFKLDIDLMGFLGEVTGGERVDVVDLNKAFLRFKFEAIKPPGEIYVKNRQARDDFEYRVLGEYLDEMYFMRQSTRDYLKFYAGV